MRGCKTLSFFHLCKACAEQARPAEQTQDPVLAAEHGRRHQIQNVMKGAAKLAGGSHRRDVQAEDNHRQAQGAYCSHSHPQDHLFILLLKAQNQKPNAGNEEDQGRQHKQYLADVLCVFHRAQAHAQDI